MLQLCACRDIEHAGSLQGTKVAKGLLEAHPVKWKFKGGGALKQKCPPFGWGGGWVGVWIFSGTTHQNSVNTKRIFISTAISCFRALFLFRLQSSSNIQVSPFVYKPSKTPLWRWIRPGYKPGGLPYSQSTYLAAQLGYTCYNQGPPWMAC